MKSVDASPQSVEGYYFVSKSLDVAYLLVTFTSDGSPDNLSFFEPGGTYKTSSDFKCQSFFSPSVIAQIDDPGDPKPERFEIPPGSGETPGSGGGDVPVGGGTVEQLINVVDPEGNIVPAESYAVEGDPSAKAIIVDLEDSNPDRPGDQPFDDGAYKVRIGDEELGGIVVQSDTLREVFGGPCVEALMVAISRRSSRKLRRKSDKITGSRSSRLEALPGSGEADVLMGASGPHVFRLGDRSGAYRAQQASHNYARISAFAADDGLLLHGGPSIYSQSGPLTIEGQVGYGLSFHDDLIRSDSV